MNILIDQTKDILSQLEETNQLIDDKLDENGIEKIRIINDELVDISDKLIRLNINLRNGNNIELSNKEKEYLKCEKNSNELISQVMPALILLSMNKN